MIDKLNESKFFEIHRMNVKSSFNRRSSWRSCRLLLKLALIVSGRRATVSTFEHPFVQLPVVFERSFALHSFGCSFLCNSFSLLVFGQVSTY